MIIVDENSALRRSKRQGGLVIMLIGLVFLTVSVFLFVFSHLVLAIVFLVIAVSALVVGSLFLAIRIRYASTIKSGKLGEGTYIDNLKSRRLLFSFTTDSGETKIVKSFIYTKAEREAIKALGVFPIKHKGNFAVIIAALSQEKDFYDTALRAFEKRAFNCHACKAVNDASLSFCAICGADKKER